MTPSVVRYEVDRSLTGMGHESYKSPPPEAARRPCDVLARQLFRTGKVFSVHIFSNLVTITLAPDTDDLAVFDEVFELLFIHYLPGVEPTPV